MRASVQSWMVGLAASVVFSSACARFGFEILDSAPDAASDGPGSGDGGAVDLGPTGAGGRDVSPGDAGGSGGDGGFGGSCAPCTCSLGAPERLGDPNYPGNDLWSPALSSDGLSLYFGLTIPGFTEQIAVSTRTDRNGLFGFGQALPAPINEGTEGSPYVSVDSLALYFYSRRAGGVGSRDLYVATRTRTADEFAGVTQLSSLNSAGLDHQPWLSSDQLRIYFVSDRSGDVDIWRSARSSLGTAFDPPVAVSELDTPSEEGGVTLSEDELEAILTSNRPGGSGGRDLYRATRSSTSEPFSAPEPLDELNTASNEIDPKFSADGSELYFASNRAGGTSSLYRVSRRCTP